MIDGRTSPPTAVCDECGAEEPTIEERGRLGELVQGNLPDGWRMGWDVSPPAHRCATCVADHDDTFGDRKAAFAARLEQLGRGLVADIATSLGVPVELGWRWADAIEQQGRRVA